MGLSMGGLCARHALANMTKNFPGTPTETRLLITHDSPHRGANVPLGLQYMIRMMGEVQLFGTGIRDIFPDYDDAIGLLNAPATQQQLLYRATTANNFANNVFLDATYRPMITFSPSDPQPTYQFIATANGNECANPLFNPSRTFINLGAGVSAGIYGRLLFFRVPILTYRLAAEVEAYALPNSGSTNKIARVYTINNLRLFGFINIFRELYNNTAFAPGNHLAVDGVPGSTSPLLDVEALNEITNLPIFAASLYVSFPLGPFLGGYFGIYAYNAGVSINFTFVPVGSALDVSPYNNNVFSQKYVNGTNQNFPSSSEIFIAQETVQNNPLVSNNVHIRFTARNSQWLYNEMENLNNNLNCSNECSNPYYISGNETICTNGVFSIPGLPRGATVIWSANPSGIVNLSCTTCLSPTLTKASNGKIILTATVTNACTSGSFQIQREITIGTPSPYWDGTFNDGGSSANQPLENTYNEVYNNTVYISLSGSSNEFTWDGFSTSGNVTWYHPVGYDGLVINFGNPPPLYYGDNISFSIHRTNSCGTASEPLFFYYVGPSQFYRVAPNPVKSTFTISQINVKDLPTQLAKKRPNVDLMKIQIIDKMGSTVMEQAFPMETKSATINTAGLKSDMYTVRIFKRDNHVEVYKIIVQH